MALGTGLRAAVAAVQREGRAGRDRIGAVGVLLPQVALDDVIKSGWGWRHTILDLLSNGWSLGGRVNRTGQLRRNWTILGKIRLTWVKGPWSDFCLSDRCLRSVGVANAGRSLGENKILPICCEPGLRSPGDAEQDVDGKWEEAGVVGVEGQDAVPAERGGVPQEVEAPVTGRGRATRPASLASVAAVAASPLDSRWSLMSSSNSCWEKVTQERATTSARCSPANDTSEPSDKRRGFPNTTAISWVAYLQKRTCSVRLSYSNGSFIS